jgi:hypothetical protein
VSRLAIGSTQPPVHHVPGALSPGAEQLGCEGNRPPKSNARVKNGGAVLPLSPVFLMALCLINYAWRNIYLLPLP